MSKVEKEAAVDRRGFLKALGAGSAGAAAGMAIGSATAAAGESPEEKKKKRYQESEHVKKFYQTNRY